MIRGDRPCGGHGESHEKTEVGLLTGIVECQRQKGDHNTEKVGDKPSVELHKVYGY